MAESLRSRGNGSISSIDVPGLRSRVKEDFERIAEKISALELVRFISASLLTLCNCCFVRGRAETDAFALLLQTQRTVGTGFRARETYLQMVVRKVQELVLV